MSRVAVVGVREVSKELNARLIAQEFVRNGMDLPAAYTTVTGDQRVRRSIKAATAGYVDAFMDELKVLLAKADVQRDELLRQLWAAVQSSILDLFDETGDILPVAELKKLPRVLQACITSLQVKSLKAPALDGDGNPLLNPDGSTVMKVASEVKVTMMSKVESIKQIAAILRLTGPELVINANTVNIANIMAEADHRQRRIGSAYDAANLRQDAPAGPAQPTH